jgi:hypothetical protein
LPCRPCCHVRGALLPHRFTLASTLAGTSAVCSLLHFPWARAPQALPGTLSTGARTFLPGKSCDLPQRLPGRRCCHVGGAILPNGFTLA